MEWVPWAQNIGPWALLVGLLGAFMTGAIVPGREHRRQLAEMRAQRDAWQASAEAEQEMRRDLEQTGRIVRTAFQAMPRPPEDV